jgi:quinol monooxygenase YgiN
VTTISAKSDVMTLINVFTVEPANERRLVELLTEATEVSVRRAPGFVSASLHRSTDGTKVTIYAQWRSIDDYQAMRQDLPHFRFFTKRSRSPSLNPASTRSCEPSHPPANRIEATTVLSALRAKNGPSSNAAFDTHRHHRRIGASRWCQGQEGCCRSQQSPRAGFIVSLSAP